MKKRTAQIKRKTAETDVTVKLNLDGTGERRNVDTGVGFFDHMLDAFARHGFFDLDVVCKGDLQVDAHHTVEDTGIVLGQAIAEALGDKKGIARYGSMTLPMDDALVLCAIDLCGRPYLVMDAAFPVETVGDFETQLVKEFFYAVSYGAMMNLHLRTISGENAHHMIEAMFKAFARALHEATRFDDRVRGVLSAKGAL